MNHISLLSFMTMPLFVGLIMGLTPYFSRKETPFGISMPLTEQTMRVINDKKKNYFITNFGLSLFLWVILLLIERFGHKTGETILCLSSIALFVMLIVFFISYIHENREMKQYKKTLNLSKIDGQKVFVDLTFREKTLIYPTSYLVVINFLFIFVTVFVTVINYANIPNEIVLHWNINMEPDRMGQKSWWTLLEVPLIQLFMTACFAFCNQAVLSAKQEINPNDPKKSLEQDKKFRKGTSLLICIISILIQCIFMIMQFGTIFPNQKILKLLMIGSFFLIPIIVIMTLWYSLHYGQGGERLDEADDSLQTTEQKVKDDSHWHWGMFYFNREDPSFWVEKRFGIGVTMNFAKWQAWVFLILILVIPIILILLMP